MKIFISWSGLQSKTVANSLRQWIPDVIQSVEPWMSETDIDAGARWSRNIDHELGDTKFGILCLTKTNLTAPWILFEAGALAKTIDETFVCPYLIDLNPSEIPAGPLTQFQAKRADEKETWELILTINKALKEDALSEEKLRRTFERWWPDLKTTLDNLPEEEESPKDTRSVENMLEEVLGLVRGLSRRSSTESVIDWAFSRVPPGQPWQSFALKFLEELPNDPKSVNAVRNWLMHNSQMASKYPFTLLLLNDLCLSQTKDSEASSEAKEVDTRKEPDVAPGKEVDNNPEA